MCCIFYALKSEQCISCIIMADHTIYLLGCIFIFGVKYGIFNKIYNKGYIIMESIMMKR